MPITITARRPGRRDRQRNRETVSPRQIIAAREQRAIADMLTSAGVSTRFLPLPCIEGHDAFLVDLETFGRHIGAFLQNRDHHVAP